MKTTRKCTVCGLEALGPVMGRAELLRVIAGVYAELERPVAHPLPPDVRTYEQLERHKESHEAFKRGWIRADLKYVVDTDMRRICWDCRQRQRAAETEELKAFIAKIDEELNDAKDPTQKPDT